jgi:FkbH-like protein
MKLLKEMLLEKNPLLWHEIKKATLGEHDFSKLVTLSTFRKRAEKAAVPHSTETRTKLRLALIGAYSFYPFRELVEHTLWAEGYDVELFVGEYDNYTSEILDPESALYDFSPQVVLLWPSEKRCRYTGTYLDAVNEQRAQVANTAQELLDLCRVAHERTQAEILFCNFTPPVEVDPGAFRSRALASPWAFRRAVNSEFGLRAPEYVTVCDVDFISSRLGLSRARDEKAWFETKQPGAPELLVETAREVCHLATSLKRSPKKVLVLDLDNTLWGGVIGDLGVEGIEVGDTSPRGEAFKAFQRYALDLYHRGVLLAVCSKNDHDVAMAPFEKHPEMVLKPSHFAAFKANWEPKSENLKAIAEELNLGLDSLVFVDDNPAEVDIVRQYAPSVTAILLGEDPSLYVRELSDARLFEPRSITEEDTRRSELYRAENERKQLADRITDMGAYLTSLEMKAMIREFNDLDGPRVAQLINKSNQFNLTTHRRTEGEVAALAHDPQYVTFSIRLEDRFGDHGLISVFIGKIASRELIIDTWLMSCRVLKRQVEEVFLNEIARLAAERSCTTLVGHYRPTAKNKMVADHYSGMGFTETARTDSVVEYRLAVGTYQPRSTKIEVVRGAYDFDSSPTFQTRSKSHG